MDKIFQTACVFNCQECGEVWDVIDMYITGLNFYHCRECGSEVKQVFENGIEKIHILTDEEEDEIALRNDNCSGWEDYSFP